MNIYYKGLSIVLSMGVFLVGFLWYSAEKGYEPIIVMITALISLVSSLVIFSPNFKTQSNYSGSSENTDQVSVSESLIKRSKNYDRIFFFAKTISKYLTAILCIIAFFYILAFIMENKDLPIENLMLRLKDDPWIQQDTLATMSFNEALIELFFLSLRGNVYFGVLAFIGLILMLVNTVFLDTLRRRAFSKHMRILQHLKHSPKFMDECQKINLGLIHHQFKDEESPRLLKMSIIEAFANIHLKHF